MKKLTYKDRVPFPRKETEVERLKKAIEHIAGICVSITDSGDACRNIIAICRTALEKK